VACDDGFCDATDPDDPVCVAYAQQGEACDEDLDCSRDPRLVCVDGVCDRREDGEACDQDFECASSLCFDDVCTPFAALSEGCGPAMPPCAPDDDLFCGISEGQSTGFCRQKGTAGRPCEDDDECLGRCVFRFGERMCDDEQPEDRAWCDGMDE